jgi:hypothetical protein
MENVQYLNEMTENKPDISNWCLSSPKTGRVGEGLRSERRYIERQQDTRVVENTDMTDCISSL